MKRFAELLSPRHVLLLFLACIAGCTAFQNKSFNIIDSQKSAEGPEVRLVLEARSEFGKGSRFLRLEIQDPKQPRQYTQQIDAKQDENYVIRFASAEHKVRVISEKDQRVVMEAAYP